jgi:hypothetical protein
MVPASSFQHLHLNSVDPDAATDFYVRPFPSSARTTWGGLPALAELPPITGPRVGAGEDRP